MNDHPGTLSPESIGGSEWSGIARYQSENSYSPPTFVPNGRNNLITPPISASSNTLNGNLSNGTNRRPNDLRDNPSPPDSVARSSNGTTISEGQRRKQSMMEESLWQHYTTLKRYLSQSLRDEKGNVKPNRARDKLLRLSPVQFQELSTDVYDELLRRQSASAQQPNAPAGIPTYLTPRDNFHPKRNQARQKLSTLPPTRFRDLATDVFYEVERRVPRFAGGNIDRTGSPASSMRGPPSRGGTPNGFRPGSREQGPPRGVPGYGPRQGSLGGQVFAGLGIPGIGIQEDGYGRPTAKTFQSNTIVPNKSTLVEDDDDQTGPEDNDDPYRLGSLGGGREVHNRSRSGGSDERERKIIADYQAQVGDLQARVSELEYQVQEKDTSIHKLESVQQANERATGSVRAEWEHLRMDLEEKLASALNLNNNLRSEIDKVKSHHAGREEELRSQLDQVSRQGNGADEWQRRYVNLERDYAELQNELQEQQMVTDEVRQETSAFLNEMKAISDRSGQNREQEERLIQQVHKLEDEIKDWKSRYARTKTQLRSLKSMSLAIQQPNAGQFTTDTGFIQQDGLVEDVFVTKFQMAIDEILRVARVGEFQSVIESMKSVIATVRNICKDINETPSSNDETGLKRAKLKSHVSATANNFITASKNFSMSKGLSPVSLLDAAASHLTAAVVELIREVKIRPTPTNELEDENDYVYHPVASIGFSTAQTDRTSVAGTSIADSVYSPLSPLSSPKSTKIQRKDLWSSTTSQSQNATPITAVPFSSSNTVFQPGPQDRDIEELKMFLEDQTESLAQAVPDLVTLIRKGGDSRSIMEGMERILATAEKVVQETQQSVKVLDSPRLRDETGSIVRKLGERQADYEAALETKRRREKEVGAGAKTKEEIWKGFCDAMVPIAFDVARQTRELVQRVEQVELDGIDDFS